LGETGSPRTTSPTEALPRPFGERYTLERELARGGMGRVYVARDHKLDRQVAIKVLATSVPDEALLRRFEQEARSAGSLHHPNILAVFDAGEHEGKPFIVMELLRGRTVRKVLEGGVPPLREALDYGLQLARGLQAAHDKGIVHRDLKPDNLFVTADGFLKILDFGIVKLLPPKAQEGERFETPEGHTAVAPALRTEAGTVIGTIGYMPPEQVRGQPVDHRADLFSFGAVLYELLSGKRAFSGGSPVETAYSILKSEPEPLPAHVPAPVRKLVQRCLRKKREERPESVRELLGELEAQYLRTPTAPMPRLTVSARALLRQPRRVALLALAALLAVGVLASRFERVRAFFAGPRSSLRVIAVLPFTVRGGAQFGYLGEGMVDLLSTNLAVAGSVRAVDPTALIPAALREGGTLDAARAGRVAARFGARLYVLGSVLEVEKRLRVHAALYDGQSPAAPLAEARAEGHASQLFHLVDEVTAQLRAGLGGDVTPVQGPGGRLGRLASMTTHSPEALKHYLEGESTLRRDNFPGARESLQRAVALDPDFALAHYRLAIASSISAPGQADDSLRAALRRSARLSVRDRSLLEAYAAFFQGRLADAERQYRAITRDNPDEVEAWYQLGELLFHMNPLRGRPSDEAEEPLGKVLVLDPQHSSALAHLIDLAQVRGERQLTTALADRYLPVASSAAGVALPVRWTRAWAMGDEPSRAALLYELGRPGAQREDIRLAAVRAVWQGDGLGDARALGQVLAETGTPAQRAEGLQMLAVLDVAQGRRRAARERLATAAQLAPEGSAAYDRLFVDTLEFLPVPPAELAADRAQAVALQSPHSSALPVLRAWVEGALALRAGDPAKALSLAAQLEKVEPTGELSVPQDLALGLRARAAARAGHRAQALALLEKMPLKVTYQFNASLVRLPEQLLRAELLAAEGKADAALRWAAVSSYYGKWEPVWLAPSHLLRARLFDKLDRRAEALQHYRRYVTLRAGCDEELRSELDEAQRRLHELEGAPQATARTPEASPP
jgi:tetratricopeptide (TPR) repeat protein